MIVVIPACRDLGIKRESLREFHFWISTMIIQLRQDELKR